MESKSIVLDIGGVFFPDIWEKIAFNPSNGLVKKAKKNKNVTINILKKIWDKYSTTSTKYFNWRELELNYWEEVLEALEIKSSPIDCIKSSNSIIKPFSEVEKIIDVLINDNIDVSICSNQTAFWFEREFTVSKVLNKIPREKMILSFECGLTKDKNSLEMYSILTKKIQNPISHAIFIDDRLTNINTAKNFGFKTIHFKYSGIDSIKELRHNLKLCLITYGKY